MANQQSTKYDFEDSAVFSVKINGKSATVILNNHKHNQGDSGFDPIRLAQFLQTFLSASGFKTTIKVLPSTFRHVDSMEFPRRSVEVKLGNKTQRALLDEIVSFNEMFNTSQTYAEFEIKMTAAKPAAPAAAPAPPAAVAAKPATSAVAPKKSFAVASAAQSAKNTLETALQAKNRLKREQEELKKREQKLVEELSRAEAAVKVDNAKLLERMLATASERDPEFMEELLEKLQNKVNPTPASVASAATTTVPEVKVKAPEAPEAPKVQAPEVKKAEAPEVKEPEDKAPEVKKLWSEEE